MVKNQNTFWHFIVYLLLLYYFDFRVVWMAIGEVEKKKYKNTVKSGKCKASHKF